MRFAKPSQFSVQPLPPSRLTLVSNQRRAAELSRSGGWAAHRIGKPCPVLTGTALQSTIRRQQLIRPARFLVVTCVTTCSFYSQIGKDQSCVSLFVGVTHESHPHSRVRRS